jgi:hypothetical protein
MIFKEGDVVVLKIGNIPYKGVITEEQFSISDREEKTFLSFRGENNYFAWLDNCCEYLRKI